MKHPRAVLRVPAMHKDGSIIAVRLTGETLAHDENGGVSGVVVTVAGRDPGWVAQAYRSGLAVLATWQRMRGSIGP
jgi:hypothetical protein